MSAGYHEKLVQNVPVLLKVSDQNGDATFFNKSWLEFTGRTFEQEAGRGWLDNMHPAEVLGYLESISVACSKSHSTCVEFRLKRADGEYRWILEDGKPLFSPLGRFESYISACLDITEYKQIQENKNNCYFDEVTGFPNSNYFDDYLRREWGRAARTVRSLTLVMFKAIHQEGCRYLKLLGDTINSELNRPGDFLAFYNKEKFVAILPETDARGAAVVVDRIRTKIQALEAGYGIPVIGLVSAVPTIDVSSATGLVELVEQAIQKEESSK